MSKQPRKPVSGGRVQQTGLATGPVTVLASPTTTNFIVFFRIVTPSTSEGHGLIRLCVRPPLGRRNRLGSPFPSKVDPLAPGVAVPGPSSQPQSLAPRQYRVPGPNRDSRAALNAAHFSVQLTVLSSSAFRLETAPEVGRGALRLYLARCVVVKDAELSIHVCSALERPSRTGESHRGKDSDGANRRRAPARAHELPPRRQSGVDVLRGRPACTRSVAHGDCNGPPTSTTRRCWASRLNSLIPDQRPPNPNPA